MFRLSRAYRHACNTKPEKLTSFSRMTSSISSINGTGKRIVLFSVSFLSDFSWNIFAPTFQNKCIAKAMNNMHCN